MIDLIDLIEVPAGTFLMGSPEDEEDRYPNEGPQHTVTFAQPFFMGKYPVTQAQWKAVAALPKIKRDLSSDPAHFKGGDLPVEQVSWLDAQEFCARLSQATDSLYRLPTEAEWEYACRAGTTTPYYFGEELDKTKANCWLRNSADKTTPVGTFPPNAWGLYDMHGNVWEWCQDEYCEDYKNAPTDGSAVWVPESESDYVIMRGGSWCDLPAVCRSADRFMGAPDGCDDNVGFRVVRGGSWFSSPKFSRSANRSRFEPDAAYESIGFRVVQHGS